jgi:hypothetical protein
MLPEAMSPMITTSSVNTSHAQTIKSTPLVTNEKTAVTSTTLSRVQSQTFTISNLLRLLYDLLALSKNQLDVAWVRHVWVDLEAMLVNALCARKDIILTRP